MRENCTIVMMRFPEKGRVKTRLAVRIGDVGTLKIYHALLRDTISAVNAADTDAILSVYGTDSGSFGCHEVFDDKDRFIQAGNDLGMRQYNSLEEACARGYRKAVVIAADSPEISASAITKAFGMMDEADAVIGPCFDGGYYLFGVRSGKLEPDIFGGINWGKETVSAELKRNLTHVGISFRELDPLHDMDTVEDLALFLKRDTTLKAPATHAIASKLASDGVIGL